MRRILLLALILSGCATKEQYMKEVNTWIGKQEMELISSWGPPNSVFDSPNGNKIYSWLKGNGSQTIGAPIGGMLFMGSQVRSCTTSFEIEKTSKLVVKVWAEGAKCVAYPGAPVDESKSIAAK